MSGEQTLWRWPLAGASLVLVGTAALHGSGYRLVARLLAESGMQPEWAAGLEALWVIFAVRLVILAAVLVTVAARAGAAGRRILAVCGLMPAADAAILVGFVGVFPGAMLLGLATLLVFTAVGLQPATATGGRAGP